MCGLVACGWIAMPTPARAMSIGDASVPADTSAAIVDALSTATSKASPCSIRVLSAAELSKRIVSLLPVDFSNWGASSSISALVAFELRTVSDCACVDDANASTIAAISSRHNRSLYSTR